MGFVIEVSGNVPTGFSDSVPGLMRPAHWCLDGPQRSGQNGKSFGGSDSGDLHRMRRGLIPGGKQRGPSWVAYRPVMCTLSQGSYSRIRLSNGPLTQSSGFCHGSWRLPGAKKQNDHYQADGEVSKMIKVCAPFVFI